MSGWPIQEAKKYYKISNWGEGVFDLDEDGSVIINNYSNELKLHEIVQYVKDRGIKFPLLLRFPHVLVQRLDMLIDAFSSAIQSNGYKGKFMPVYPIKVNQHKSVSSVLINTNNVGLEVGSKAELMLSLAINSFNGLLICNGYKDFDYIKAACLGSNLGNKICIVIDKPHEVHTILRVMQELDIYLPIGVRIRLSTLGKGKWQNTGGELSKFGLSSHELLDVVKILKENKQVHLLQLLHFHMGSQIADIEDIRLGLQEGIQNFNELQRLGANIEYLDIGGGVGVDYEGNESKGFFSMNYSINDYARCVIEEAKKIKNSSPIIITELGRFMTAHHAVLIVDNIEQELDKELNNAVKSNIFHEAIAIYNDSLKIENLCDNYKKTYSLVTKTHKMYVKNEITIEHKAEFDLIIEKTWYNLYTISYNNKNISSDIKRDLRQKVAIKLFCNFSIFKSTPDVWGIQQIFPILPLMGLNIKPSKRYVIEDMTCDSDGRINDYISNNSESDTTLSLPNNIQGNLGIFLVGAYQEILGDNHNLFGNINRVDIIVNDNGFSIANLEDANTIKDMINQVGYKSSDIISMYKSKLNAISPDQKDMIHKYFLQVLGEDTYLNMER